MKKVVLINKETKILAEIGKKISTHFGIIDTSKVKLGKKIKSHLGKEFFVVEPNLIDIIENLKRGAQVILPKDIALIIAFTGLKPNWKVLDAGTGSGFSSIFLANFLTKGKVYTYEKDERFYKIAKENFEFCELDNIVLIFGDVRKCKEKNFNMALLDFENSDKILKFIDSKILVGGFIVIYSPTVNHLLKNVKALSKIKKYSINIFENIVREWQYEKTLRPKTKGIIHTGFLIIARKFSE
ncbi:MAG: methyltransferase domain-containing protein [Candidatus Aenigmatarchaeota archaeon]